LKVITWIESLRAELRVKWQEKANRLQAMSANNVEIIRMAGIGDFSERFVLLQYNAAGAKLQERCE
jgi:hypothetical protein